MGDRDANWALFYKFHGDVPCEFSEVRWFDDTVFSATGRVETWGHEQVSTLPGQAEASREYKRLCLAAEGAGFRLSRAINYDPTRFDAPNLTSEISAATRRALAHVRLANPDRTINAFAILTDSSAMTIAPVSGTVNLQTAPAESDAVWNCEEWSFFDGGAYFDIAYRIVLSQHRGIRSQVAFSEFRTLMFEACISSLEQLIDDGVFGTPAERENMVVRFQVSDNDEIDGAMDRLNPPSVVARYKAWLAEWR